jgi:hypothetical protein
MAVIQCDDSQKEAAAQAFPCQQVEFPIKYLGIPLSTGRLPRSALQPLLDKAADKLPIWKGSMMHRAGRLALVKSMLSAVPICTYICMGLLAWMYKGLTKLAKASLDQNRCGTCGQVFGRMGQDSAAIAAGRPGRAGHGEDGKGFADALALTSMCAP